MTVGEGKSNGASGEIEKNKEGHSPADATFTACKILLQPADTGTHLVVVWMWKDRDQIRFFLSPFILHGSEPY